MVAGTRDRALILHGGVSGIRGTQSKVRAKASRRRALSNDIADDHFDAFDAIAGTITPPLSSQSFGSPLARSVRRASMMGAGEAVGIGIAGKWLAAAVGSPGASAARMGHVGTRRAL
jgi:hypothetical protein